MANYDSHSRTNYFKVKDIEAFKEALSPLFSKLDVEIWVEEKNGEAHVAFGGDDILINPQIENEQEEIEEIDIAELIQPHLQDGEACIITEIGKEKLRYVGAGSLIITKDSAQYLDLNNTAVQLAAALTQKDPDDFHMHN